MTKNRFKIRVAVYLLLEKDSKILLYLRQNSGFADGHYSLISGHLEENETITQAMIREAKEEAGITIAPRNLRVVHVLHCLSNIQYVSIFFHCTKWSGAITNLEPTKCGQLAFFDKNNLPKNILNYVTQALEKMNLSIMHSEIGSQK